MRSYAKQPWSRFVTPDNRANVSSDGIDLLDKLLRYNHQERLTAADCKDAGVDVLTGGTAVHLVLADLRNSEMNGQEAEDLLHEVGITVNRNAVPFDPRPPMVTSGLRIGTPALATRGFDEKAFEEVADIIGTALAAGKNADTAALRARVSKLAEDFPLYEGLEDWTIV